MHARPIKAKTECDLSSLWRVGQANRLAKRSTNSLIKLLIERKT